ncbi:MAG: DNA (cytosine-5-)-methyltransferase [Candidatus Dormibacteraeota bacterium]|uniref:DNA (cytosine-5-)-methyltransferase n=2 Tax=Candidatus Dormiibacter inghamiae TaxID=3127013 RepID=A0A934NC59_9BACT|nr:DNA (cytosine-5-)-methyltransferase [Candidatus Dormibacteraeota bacterium]
MRTIPPLSRGPLTDAERLDVLDRIDEILELKYRSAGLGNFDDPLEEAVYILLSRQTREAGYQRAHRELRARWPTWQALMAAPVGDITEVIRPAGFGATRAAQLQGLLEGVATACADRGTGGRLTLDWLKGLPDAEVEAFLTSLPGLGVKSARCVMHYALGRKTLAVDTHVRRTLGRLGLVPDTGGKVRHASYESAVPARMRQRLHVNLIHHGRAYCRSKSPRCTECPLISFCPNGRAAQETTSTKPVAVELFAGGGGLGEGFTLAGFRVAVAVEIDRHAAQTYRINHPGTVVIEADATKISAKQLQLLAPLASQATAVIAGPPCQGYSAAGRRKADDKKNDLYTAVINLTRQIKPRFVVIENVPGMQKVGGKSFVETVLGRVQKEGYAVKEHLLRACDFGVPQLRRRLLFLAQRHDWGLAPEPPQPSHCAGDHCEQQCGKDRGSRCGRKPTPTVLESLTGLPKLDHGQHAEYVILVGGKILLNGSTMRHSEHVIQKIKTIKPGTGPISYRRLHPDVARTIVAGHRALPVHPILDRTLSVREAARIQGFRDDHVFAGPRSHQPLQVANAVPPPLALAVAAALLALGSAGGNGEAEPVGRGHPDSPAVANRCRSAVSKVPAEKLIARPD